ncbi:unnamed protein product [Lactuca saligna]|uniref:Uncharacterized protein n=1 Tax=Lactuca saligna TaxID=75948 RepID=A0AA35VC70_LACSI|nr:unnamed protein product [Lactuca saligna]
MGSKEVSGEKDSKSSDEYLSSSLCVFLNQTYAATIWKSTPWPTDFGVYFDAKLKAAVEKEVGRIRGLVGLAFSTTQKVRDRNTYWLPNHGEEAKLTELCGFVMKDE